MDNQIFINYRLKFNQHLYKLWQNRCIRHVKLMKVNSSGLEKIPDNDPALIAPNHLNWKDIFFISGMIHRPINFAASLKLFDKNMCHKMLDQYIGQYIHHPILQNAIHRFNAVLAKFLVDRIIWAGAFPAKLDSYNRTFLKAAKTALKQNKLVCVFPEAGLGLPEKLRRFKLGTPKLLYEYYLEFRKSIPVFPIGITGTQKFYYPGMKLGFHVGSPMYIDNYIQSNERQTLLTFAKELQKAVRKLLDYS